MTLTEKQKEVLNEHSSINDIIEAFRNEDRSMDINGMAEALQELAAFKITVREALDQRLT